MITDMLPKSRLVESSTKDGKRIGGADGPVLKEYLENHAQKDKAEKFPSLALPDNVKGHDWDDVTAPFTSILGDLSSEPYIGETKKSSIHRDLSPSRSQSTDERERNYKTSNTLQSQAPDIPQDFEVYQAIVETVAETTVTLYLTGFPQRWECVLHHSAIQHGHSRINPRDVLRPKQRVYVKVLSQVNGVLSVSMRDVDQVSGRDLRPQKPTNSRFGPTPALDGSVGDSQLSAFEKKRQDRLKELDARPLPRRASSRERWERKQVDMGTGDDTFLHPMRDKRRSAMGAGMDRDDRGDRGDGISGLSGTFHDEGDLGAEEEEIDIEMNENEPAFLRGQIFNVHAALTGSSASNVEGEGARVVKMPDGSMQRAALAQSAKTKERRELREFQRQQQLESLPADLAQNWEDPLAVASDRRFAADLRSITEAKSHATAEAEWRKESLGAGVTGKVTSLSIKQQRESLPIYKLRDDFLQKFRDVQVMVVIGETGSGKTTQMTQYLMEAGYSKNRKMIGCTQPRRVAAQSIAKRVSEEVGCKLGSEVGYAVRFEDVTSPDTVIKYMTDGMLLREILISPDLDRYSVIILDEAHERTVNTDVLFGLLKSAMRNRPDLKLIVTSASLEAEKFSGFFGGCHIYKIPGRTFPVTIHHVQQPEEDYLQAGLNTAMQIHLSRPPGDILLFLTGKEEIDTACEYLYEQCKMLGPKCPPMLPLPVYSALDSELQAKIFEPAPKGTRKCVIATNIAEASLTIDGIYFVVDPGFCKINVYDPKLGKDELRVTPISQASAKQRAGRAGRTGPGECYRLYTQQAFLTEMLPATVPEIQRRNLAEVVLMLKAMGINDMLGFDFMDPPPISTMITALQHLYSLGALDEEGLLTRLGRKMAEFPLPPQLAKVIICAVDLQCTEEILTVVAMISDEDVFTRPKDKQAQADARRSRFFHPMGDHLTLLRVYEEWIKSKSSAGWCAENFISARAMKKAQDVRKQLCAIMDRYRMPLESCHGKIHRVCRSVASGYFMHAARKDPTEGYKTLVEQQVVYIHPASSLYTNQPEWIIYHKLILTTKEYLHSCMVIDPKWLVDVAPNFFKQCDANQISRRRRKERLEPLHDKFHDPNAWRLSKRKG